MDRGVLRALNRPVRCMADVEDSLSMEPFIMQRLIIILQPLSLLSFSPLWFDISLS